MKGMLYLYAANNKGGWALTGGCFILAAVLCIAATRAFVDCMDLVVPAGMASFFLPLFVSVIPTEILLRDYEKVMKSRFTGYVLSGMTKHTFVLTELVKNLLTTLACIVLDFSLLGIVAAVGGGDLLAAEIFQLHAFIIIGGMGLLNWIAMTPTTILKSQEKASLVIGLPLGCIVGILMSILFIRPELEQSFYDILSKCFTLQGQLIIYAIIVALYALFYVIFYLKVRKGDV